MILDNASSSRIIGILTDCCLAVVLPGDRIDTELERIFANLQRIHRTSAHAFLPTNAGGTSRQDLSYAVNQGIVCRIRPCQLQSVIVHRRSRAVIDCLDIRTDIIRRITSVQTDCIAIHCLRGQRWCHQFMIDRRSTIISTFNFTKTQRQPIGIDRIRRGCQLSQYRLRLIPIRIDDIVARMSIINSN